MTPADIVTLEALANRFDALAYRLDAIYARLLMLEPVGTPKPATLPLWRDIDSARGQMRISALEAFILEQEPAAPHDEAWRAGLTAVVAELSK